VDVGVLVTVGVMVDVAVAVGVSVGTGVTVGVFVAVGVSVGVTVGVSVGVGVIVGVSVGVGVLVAVAVAVGVGVAVGVSVGVDVLVGVLVGVGVRVAVGVAVGVGVSVGVAVAVGVGVGSMYSMTSLGRSDGSPLCSRDQYTEYLFPSPSSSASLIRIPWFSYLPLAHPSTIAVTSHLTQPVPSGSTTEAASSMVKSPPRASQGWTPSRFLQVTPVSVHGLVTLLAV